MKNFFKDYVALCRASGAFMKKHWLGYIILCVVSSVAAFAWLERGKIKEKFIGKKKENKKEEKLSKNFDNEW